jgi:serine/threonine-protein kinase ATR
MFESIQREKWNDVATDARAYGERFARAFGPSSARSLVESVEIGNEPGKWSDADYRAMFENMARGLRAGDPKLRIVTCALTTGKSHAYAKSVECVAGLEALFDVLNVHSYPEMEGWPTWRRSFPEDPKLKSFVPDITNLCGWRDAHAPGKQVWLTEFGYDSSTKQPEPKTEFKQWVGVSDEQQAAWLVRSWLLFATLPIDRAYVYFFNDSDEPHVHGSSGLTRNFVPKPSFYAAAQLKRLLGDLRFKRKFAMGEATAEEFENGPKRTLVIWLASGDGRKARVELPEFQRLERMVLSNSADGTVKADGRLVEVGEGPIYVILK